MAISKILAEKNGRKKEFTPATWALMPEGKYGWVALSGPTHIAKGKVPTPPEAMISKKVDLEKKSIAVNELDTDIPKDTGIPPKGAIAEKTVNPSQLPPKTEKSKNKGGRPSTKK